MQDLDEDAARQLAIAMLSRAVKDARCADLDLRDPAYHFLLTDAAPWLRALGLAEQMTDDEITRQILADERIRAAQNGQAAVMGRAR